MHITASTCVYIYIGAKKYYDFVLQLFSLMFHYEENMHVVYHWGELSNHWPVWWRQDVPVVSTTGRSSTSLLFSVVLSWPSFSVGGWCG